MFRVVLEKPTPEAVKLSRKNVAFVTIEQGDDYAEEEAGRAKLIEFFVEQRRPTWAA